MLKSEKSSCLILSIFRHGVTPPAQPLPAVQKQLSLPQTSHLIKEVKNNPISSSSPVTGPLANPKRGYRSRARPQQPFPRTSHSSGLSQRARQRAINEVFSPRDLSTYFSRPHETLGIHSIMGNALHIA